ncbi:Bud-site selection protein [Crepidotus variabilis]|uniref:Bud-site selection protein n=1 Tax=Crepidotus variabilis TaxID=179855 RepID=A0A9P6EQ70_9AGAR|nr:Bud-site selection protein [Crepidotus variabilis]
MAKELSITTPQPSQGSAAKVHSRLLSSKILAKQVADSVLSLKAVLDPSLKTKGKAVKPAKTKEDGLDADENAESLSEDAIEGPRKKMKAPPAQADDQDQEDAGWESGTVNGDDEDIDEGEDGWESESIGQRPGLALEVDNSANDGSSSEDDSSPVSELAVKSIKPKLKATTTSKLPLTGGNSKLSSTFLPSLSVGFVRGGSSDSDFEDDGAEGKAGDLPKKNRRGQRARQAIWEKKFGRNANHKKKKVFKEQERSVQAAYAQRKGKIGTRPNARPQMKGAQGLGLRQVDSSASLSGWKQHQDTGPRTHEKAQPDSGWSNTASRNSKLKSADDKPLHPSWEAKKRLKEKESGSLVPSQGKKIKF